MTGNAFAQIISEITSSESVSLINTPKRNSTILIDARDSAMFAQAHIRNAINIDAFSPDAEQKLVQVKSYDSVLVYCTKTNRTNQIAQMLQAIGYNGSIIKITDGFTGWSANGFETVSESLPKPIAQQKVDENSKAETVKGKPIIQVFGNFDYNATDDAKKTYGFWFGRAHFGYEYQFSEQISGKIIIDAGRPTTVGQIEVEDTSGNSLDVTNKSKEGSYYTMTLKFASIEWKPNSIVRLQAGGVLQNHYITQEKFWGYRYLAPTFQDKYYGIPSGDLGIIGYFTLNEMFGFDVALTNGEGFRYDQDEYGDVKLAGGIDFKPMKGLQTRLYTDYTKSDNPLKPAEQQLFSIFAGYRFDNKFRIGAEYNYRKNHLNINKHNLYGFSVYSSVLVAKNVALFGRFDQLNANTIGGDTQSWYNSGIGNAYIAGAHYNPVKGVNISLNYQGWKPKDSSVDFQNHIVLSFEYKL